MAAQSFYSDFIFRFRMPDKVLHGQNREFEIKLFKKLTIHVFSISNQVALTLKMV